MNLIDRLEIILREKCTAILEEYDVLVESDMIEDDGGKHDGLDDDIEDLLSDSEDLIKPDKPKTKLSPKKKKEDKPSADRFGDLDRRQQVKWIKRAKKKVEILVHLLDDLEDKYDIAKSDEMRVDIKETIERYENLLTKLKTRIKAVLQSFSMDIR